MDDLTLTQQLEALRATYATRLRERAGEISQAWERLALSGAAEDLAHAHHLAHRLAGSAATYGFTRISELARALELRLAGEAGGPLSPEGQAAAAALVAELLSAVAEPGG